MGGDDELEGKREAFKGKGVVVAVIYTFGCDFNLELLGAVLVGGNRRRATLALSSWLRQLPSYRSGFPQFVWLTD